MDTTTIALDREAYEALRSAKRTGESFSSTVKRLAGARRPLSEFAGTWKHLSTEELQEMRDSVLTARAIDREKVRRHRHR